MKFGVRECCDVVFRAKRKMELGNKTFYKDEPVIYFDTLKTSSLEGAATTVYAQGGRGNARLIGWDGDRTLTFTMEDALISPEGIAILTGAGIIEASATKTISVHTTEEVTINTGDDADGTDGKAVATLTTGALSITHLPFGKGTATAAATIDTEKGIYVMLKDPNGNIITEPMSSLSTTQVGRIAANITPTITVDGYVYNDYKTSAATTNLNLGLTDLKGCSLFVDYYIKKTKGVYEIDITPDKFGDNFYIEAATLFRDQATGEDMPAEFIIPNGKIQSNFTFTMAGSGDPSSFTFTVDAFPGMVDGKKVLAAIQIVKESVEAEEARAQTDADTTS